MLGRGGIWDVLPKSYKVLLMQDEEVLKFYSTAQFLKFTIPDCIFKHLLRQWILQWVFSSYTHTNTEGKRKFGGDGHICGFNCDDGFMGTYLFPN